MEVYLFIVNVFRLINLSRFIWKRDFGLRWIENVLLKNYACSISIILKIKYCIADVQKKKKTKNEGCRRIRLCT